MPVVETLEDGRIRLTGQLLAFVWTVAGVSVWVSVPAGFESDGASIPRILQPVLGPPIGNRHLKAAIVHDWLCVNARTYEERVIGDAIFFSELKACSVQYWRRALLYAGVRLYARFVWTPKQEAKVTHDEA